MLKFSPHLSPIEFVRLSNLDFLISSFSNIDKKKCFQYFEIVLYINQVSYLKCIIFQSYLFYDFENKYNK